MGRPPKNLARAAQYEGSRSVLDTFAAVPGPAGPALFNGAISLFWRGTSQLHVLIYPVARRTAEDGFGAGGNGPPDASGAPTLAIENGVVQVPDAQFLLRAEFTRSDDDLILAGSDGTDLLVQDFFSHNPVLMS